MVKIKLIEEIFDYSVAYTFDNDVKGLNNTNLFADDRIYGEINHPNDVDALLSD